MGHGFNVFLDVFKKWTMNLIFLTNMNEKSFMCSEKNGNLNVYNSMTTGLKLKNSCGEIVFSNNQQYFKSGGYWIWAYPAYILININSSDSSDTNETMFIRAAKLDRLWLIYGTENPSPGSFLSSPPLFLF